ncbi:MAG: PaaI family thioesterase [Solirubrobacterales bacterium]|nr:PaaI family thioesterase [Solirubrobacterales bacterium]
MSATTTSEIPEGFSPYPEPGRFLELIGPVHVRESEGDEPPVLGLRLDERHLNHRGTVQGGLLTTLADFALGRVIRHDADHEHELATVSITSDFLGPASAGDWVEAHAHAERVGGRLAFADCALVVDGREIVRSRAVFAVVK